MGTEERAHFMIGVLAPQMIEERMSADNAKVLWLLGIGRINFYSSVSINRSKPKEKPTAGISLLANMPIKLS